MFARIAINLLVASCAFQSIFAAHSESHQVPLARTNAEALARGDRVLAPASFITSTDVHGRTRTLPVRRSKLAKRAQTSATVCGPTPDVRFNIAVRGTNGADVGFVSNGPNGGFVVAQDISQAIVVQLIAGVNGLPSVVFSLSAADGAFALMGSSDSGVSSGNIGPGTTGFSTLVYSAFGAVGRLGSANVLGGQSQAAIWIYSCTAGVKTINAVVVNAQGTAVQTTLFYSLVDGALGLTGDYPIYSRTVSADASAAVVFSLVAAANVRST